VSERLLPDWLDAYLEYTQGQESPEKLHLWTAMALLSATVRRRIWLDRGFYKIHPNLYVLIIDESGRSRKSTAIDIGMNLIRSAVTDIHYITGSMTQEGLAKAMNQVKVEPNFDATDKPNVKTRGDIFIHADELANLLSYDKQRAAKLAMFLTEIYSTRDRYEHTIKSEARLVLKNLYVTLLAATAPQNLKVLPAEIVTGLIGRLIVVVARGKRRPIAWPQIDNVTRSLEGKLKTDLIQISTLQGEMRRTKTADDLFETWYNQLAAQESPNPHVAGFLERCHDTALRIAMLISLSRSDELLLTDEHLAGGIRLVEDQLPEFTRVAGWAGPTDFSQNRAKMVDGLRRHGGKMGRSRLLRYMAMSLEDYVRLEATLVAEGTIKPPRKLGNKQLVVELMADEI